MYLEKIHIENYKAIEKLDVDLKPGVNLIIGDNGAGKTSVLEGIAVALGGFFVNVAGVSTKNIVKDDVRMSIKPIGDSSTTIEYYEPVSAGCTLHVTEKQDFAWNRIKEEVSATHTKIDDKNVCVWMKKLTNNSDTILPLISFQSAARAWRVRRGDFGTELKKKLDDRRCGYIGCLDSSMDVKSIQQWCLKQEVVRSNKRTVREYEMFKNIVASFMKEINELTEVPSIYYSPQFTELVYKDNKTEMPISKLSAGYQSLLWMVMDLAYRVCMLNPELESRDQIMGIVLIDEIDLHLHPKWQWNVIDALQKTFAGVQFIIATHSPIVISASKDANLILLDGNGTVSYLPDCYGYEVEDVLRFRQESVSRPKKVKMLVDEIDNAIDDTNFDKAEDSLERLKEVLGDDNSEYKKMAGMISDAKLIEEC
ncbi:AAA family ATPase [Blautia sp. LMAG:89]|uniref:AAA family ATPase n=1 Tax=Blautia sp. LMAG:89 TaxID=1969173 RepID=UPI00257A0C9C|nr:AAA family ATPase [Blautia sp. LMAG:89]